MDMANDEQNQVEKIEDLPIIQDQEIQHEKRKNVFKTV